MNDRPAFLIEPALARVMAALPDARVVGGAVRDALAGREITDIDIATPQRPAEVIRALQAAGIRFVPTGVDHGTVTAVVDGRGFEITTLRRDIETDGRHAVVAFTDDWEADAARRDFTINAMSMSRTGDVFDYFGGRRDLRAGIVRFVGEPAKRIAEDYLRILRYFRFFARYSSGPADTAAVAAIRAGIPGLAGLSAERVWSEMSRILAAPDPRATLSLMAGLGVLDAVLPEGSDPPRLERLVEAGAPCNALLRLAALFKGNVISLAARFRMSGADRDRLISLSSGPIPRPDDDDANLRRLLANEQASVLIERCWLAGGAAPRWSTLRCRLASIERPVFPLEGRDVLAIGEPEGPRIGALLREVRQWWLDGGCIAGKCQCLAELARRRGRG